MNKTIPALFVAVTVAGALACAPADPALTKVDAPGITNFTRIDGASTLAGTVAGFGGATLPAAMPWLRDEGFATVINLRLASEPGADIDSSRAAAEAAGLNYLHLPFDAGHSDPDTVSSFLAAVSDKANQPVYIHCNSATRVAALWMIGRVIKDDLGIEAASEEAEAIALKPADAIAFATRYLASPGN